MKSLSTFAQYIPYKLKVECINEEDTWLLQQIITYRDIENGPVMLEVWACEDLH